MAEGLEARIQAAIMALPQGTPQAVVDAVAQEIKSAYRTSAPPGPGPSESNPSNYIAKKGDSLSQIAKDYDTTVEKIAEHNKIKNVNEIKEGQVLDMSFAIAL